jgi:hypothetical protein
MVSRLCSLALLATLAAVLPFAQYMPPGNSGTNPSSGSGIQKGNGLGGFAVAAADTDYQSVVVHNVITAGAKCDGTTDDHAALQTAANTAGIWYFPPNATCVVGDSAGAGSTGVTMSTTGVTWIGNQTTLKKLTGSTGDMLWFRSGAQLILDGFTIDQNGQASSGGDNYTTMALDGTVPILRNILFKNSGAANASGAFWGFFSGIQAYNVTVDSTLSGGTSGQFLIQGAPAGSITKIDKCSFNGGTYNQLFIKQGGTGTEISVTDTWFNNIGNQAGNTGQTGNALLCYQCTGKLTVRGNHFIKPIFTGVRLNQTFPAVTWRGTWAPGFTYATNDGVFYKGYLYAGQTASNLGNQPDVATANWSIVGDLHAVIDSNVVDGAGEASIYAEFGTEGSVISNNKVMNGSSAIVSTNLSSRAFGIHQLITGNQITNMNLKCFHIESDTLSGNSCSNSPLGVEMGFGGTGQANILGPNTWTNVTVPVAVDASLGATPANQVTTSQMYSGTGDQGAAQVPSPAAIAFSGSTTLNISNISNAASAVVTFSSGTQPSVGQVYLLTMIYGMDQINGQLCTVSASTLTTFTCNINSSTYSAWAANPVGDANPQAMLIYSSGTTASSGVPAAVVGLNGLVASYDATALSANLGTQTLFSSAPAAGLYRTTCYIVITRAATTSSTTPNCALVYTKEGDTAGSGALGWFSGGITSNVVGQGVNATDDNTVRLQAGSNLQLSTVNYASSGATTMQYAIHVRVFYLGP